MSFMPFVEPDCTKEREPSVDLEIDGRKRDLGAGFSVRRLLPSAARRMVGPFIFVDHMGPVQMAPGHGLDVRPHPHIGLATVTYLFEGVILHRDTLGSVQRIEPGAVNWMTAGRGIAHSERTPPDVRAKGGRVFGIQLWVALPKALEESAPAFEHTPAVPELQPGVKLVFGEAFGVRSPVKILSEMFYVAAELKAGERFKLPDARERAVYDTGTGKLAIYPPGEVVLHGPARVVILGGEPADGPRHMWWNFIHSSHERIEQARQDWREQRFGKVPGEHEFIPLPEQWPPKPVRYP